MSDIFCETFTCQTYCPVFENFNSSSPPTELTVTHIEKYDHKT